MYKIGFIGAGNMGSALAIAASKTVGNGQIIITDHNNSKLTSLESQIACVIAKDEMQIVTEAKYIFLAVKPNVIREVARKIAPVLKKNAAANINQIIVTIAAGVSIDSIADCIGHACPILRLMPNTPVAIGKGTTLLAYHNDVEQEIVEEFLNMMSNAGHFETIPEGKIDITSSINGCAPAYAYMFIEALADGAVQVGVPRAQAIRLAAQTVLGSAAMILETGKHPDQLKDEVCSPGGSTIVGVEALEANNFRYAAAQSIVKSTEKNCGLGK